MSARIDWMMLGVALERRDFDEAHRRLDRLRASNEHEGETRAKQPIDARSLDLGLRHLGFVVTVEHATPCAVCGEPIAAGTRAIESTATQSLAHTCCGEALRGNPA